MDAPFLYRQKDPWQIQQQLVGATLFRAAFSRRQLYERMVEFWSDHFNIYYPKVGILKIVDDRTVARANALKTFPDLLKASAHSAAMMVYLDNASSPRVRPNQNYGRELLELHTMGVNGGYTQQDVLEVARCFTGWTVDWDRNSTRYGTFVFNPAGHDNGKKVVLGVTIPERGGKNDGDTVLKILAEHPSTARHISYKMARWLLRYEPSEALVTEVARVYTNNKGDVRAMIRAILRERYLVAAPAKFKRPSQHFVSMLQALGSGVEDPLKLSWPLHKLGQPLFEWPAPNGYPDSLGYWVGGQLPRWNAAAMMAYGWLGAHCSIEAYRGLTPRQFLSKINDNLFGGEMDPADRGDLLAYVTSRPEFKEGTIREALALACSLPSFQWY
jgi:uncharacterized protein (DUF1800 family)